LLAASIMSTTLMGFGGFLFSERAAMAQDRPPAAEQLTRGAALFDQKNYGEAKRILTDIDPAQLPEEQRARRADLLARADAALLQALAPNERSASAKADADAGRLASAAAKYQSVINDSASAEAVKQDAQVQLALVKQKQADQVPAMKQLLDQAQALYDQNKLDDAQNALDTVMAVGADLGWDNNSRVPQLQGKIAEKKLALARGTGGVVAAAPGAAPGAAAGMAPMAPMAPLAAPAPNPMDLAPLPGTAGTGAAPGGLLQSTKELIDINRERIYTLYTQSRQAAKDALDKSQFQAAHAQAQQALDLINQNPSLFSDIEASSLRDAAQAQLDLIDSRQQSYQRDQQIRQGEIARIDETNRNITAKQVRQQKVAALVADARKLYEATQFREASDLLRQATIIDPQDENAALLLRLVLDKITDRDYDQIQHRIGQEVMRQAIDSEEHLIPYADLMVYPDNWPEITRKRGGGESTQDSAANRAVRDRL